MPKIGKRILKSSLAVFLCFMIYELRGRQGIVFYSCIAAVLCVQQNSQNTIKVARNRVEGTLLGGFMGLLILLLEKSFLPHGFIIIQYAIISLMIILIIYISVVLKMTSASYISCVVFMSITVSHGADINPYMFAIDRMVDTLIGIVVALGLNTIHLPRKKEMDTLYYIDYDVLYKHGQIDRYAIIKLHHLLERGAHIGLLSDETCGVFMKDVQSIPTLFPIVCLRGAMLYDTITQTYLQVNKMTQNAYLEVMEYLTINHEDCFVYSIIYDVLHIYYGELKHEKAQQYYEDVRKQPYENYVYGQLPDEQRACAIMLIKDIDDIQQCYTHLQTQPFMKYFYAFIKPYQKNKDFMQLFITPITNGIQPIHELMKQHALHHLRILSSHQEEAFFQMATSYDNVEESDGLKKLENYFYHPHKKNKEETNC